MLMKVSGSRCSILRLKNYYNLVQGPLVLEKCKFPQRITPDDCDLFKIDKHSNIKPAPFNVFLNKEKYITASVEDLKIMNDYYLKSIA